MKFGRIGWGIVGLLSLSATSWASEPIAVLSPADAELGFGGGFGASVGISGDWMVIGAPSDREQGFDTGAAYVFRRSGARWVQHSKLPEFGLSGFSDTFGHAVAIDGDRIVVGVPNLDFGTAGTGQGFIFERIDRGTPGDLSDDIWLETAFLHPPPSHICCAFGISVDIDGDVIVVGQSDLLAGNAYVFRWDGSEWLADATLRGSDTVAGDGFGVTVGVGSSVVVVGASKGDGTVDGTGAVYVFERGDHSWLEVAKLFASDGQQGAQFGSGIAVGPRFMAIGGRGNFHDGGSTGVAYLFTFDGKDWLEGDQLFPQTPEGRTSVGAFLDTDGSRLILGTLDEVQGSVFEVDGSTGVEIDRLNGPGRVTRPTVAIDGLFAMVANQIYAIGERFSLADYARLQNCVSRGSEPISPACQRFDLESDGKIDARDFALMSLTLHGPQAR